MSILGTFINFDCHNFNYLHIQFSIPISIQVAPGSCHGVQRKAKSRKALKLNDIKNSEHAAVHAVYNLQCQYSILYWWWYIYIYNINTQGCTIFLYWWRIIIWHIPPLTIFHIHHFANLLIWFWMKSCQILEDYGHSYRKCLHNSFLAFKIYLMYIYIYYHILCSSPPNLQLSRNKPGVPHDSQCTPQNLQN